MFPYARFLSLGAVVIFGVQMGAAGAKEEPRSSPDSLTGSPAKAPPEPSAVFQTVVHGERMGSDSARIGREDLLEHPAPSIGPALEALPGVSAIRKAADSTQLVLRGLSGERVRTTVAGVPLFGACPAQMDPPVTYLGVHGLDHVDLALGQSSVTRGPAGLGVGLDVSMDYERAFAEQSELHALIDTTYDSARSGAQVGASVYGGASWLDARASASFTKFHDYHSGDGTQVPARFHQTTAALSVGLRPHADHRLQQTLLYRNDGDIDFPSLPMDNIDTDLWLYSAAYRWAVRRGPLRRVVVQGGLSRIDHLMDNRYKTNRPKLEAATPTNSGSTSAAAHADLKLATAHELNVGVDFYASDRDAVRTRRMVASGQIYKDHLWPDVLQWDLGAFVQHSWHLTSQLELRSGVRADLVSSAARAADDPSLGGLTVREQYVRFYGPEAAEVDRVEAATSANLLLEWRPEPRVSAHFGGGLAMRPAGTTERYFAFGPAPGGFQVGNPTLSAEKKWSAELGISLKPRWLAVGVSAHYAFVDDFILESVVDSLDVNGDGAVDPVRGFSNVASHLVGFELRAEPRPFSWLVFPLQLSYVRGWNTTDGRDLPQIPPFEGRAAARIEHGQRYRWWAEFSVRAAAAQGFIDEEFGETETDGFALLNLRAGVAVSKQLRLECVAENLLDSEYREHLTRPALLASGDLQAGQPIPSPGRRIVVSLQGQL